MTTLPTTTTNSSLAASPGPERAAWVGRLNLYSLSVFLVCGSLAFAAGVVWLFNYRHPWLAATFHTLFAVATASGAVLFVSLFLLQRWLAPPRNFAYAPLAGARIHVSLTAYNDEACIGDAVKEFRGASLAGQVIVVENNSKDRTRQEAQEAGADRVITEEIPGYGSCCMRALAEAAEGLGDSDVIILCEGDMTFSACDIPKFLAYLENCDLVLGTRATQELREKHTQMDWLINPANQVVAKLIQTRFWGTRLTDCGCTYRALRVGSYRRLAPNLIIRGNHFSPHMYIEALKLGMRVIEIPIVFRKRQGLSKGVGSNKIKAAKVALAMLGLIYRA